LEKISPIIGSQKWLKVETSNFVRIMSVVGLNQKYAKIGHRGSRSRVT